MTNITFYRKNDKIIGFEVFGHAGKNERNGHDLLCCEISTVAQLAVVGISEVAKIKKCYKIHDGYLEIHLSEKDADNEKIQFLFETCLKSFKSIVINEEKYAKLEVKNV
ncbi:MAG: ribosomal-processing cysteine protease Prp [Clostridia bacterium]|nr:ribosomal-processing cysteine protease Prp [Clostridia bacterium]